MATITTARILADKALQETCGQECVDWAISMLEQGRDGHHLTMLAGMSPPFNHFELADYRDRSLRELGITDITDSAAITTYAAERLRLALAGKADLASTLRTIKDLYVGADYLRDLRDFYLLYFAYTDLQESEFQWYWPDANRENITSLIHDRAEAFLRSTGNA